MTMRGYQAQAVNDVREAMRSNRRVLLQMVTGSGKTHVASDIIRSAHDKNRKVIMVAPRRELVFQAADKLESCGMSPDIIMAGEPRNLYGDVQVASFDTLASRRNRGPLPDADLLIVDEAHTAITDARMDIMSQYPRVIGLTATPARSDGRGLGEAFDAMVHGPSIRELVAQNHLVPIRYFAPSTPDLEAVKLKRDGDYQEASLSGRMNTPDLIGDAVSNWQRIGQGRRTFVYTVDRAHGRAVTDQFLAAGIRTEYIDGETPKAERKAILERIATGETTVVVSVMVLTYGVDVPAVSCCVLLRPTRNIALYLQIVGRVMRTSRETGKVDALVIDHAGAVAQNGFADDDIPWSLDGREKIADRIEAQKKEKSEPKEIECPACHSVFKGRRDCPNCGHVLIQAHQPIPCHEADLQEVTRAKETAAEKRNRTTPWQDKARFFGELKAYARLRGKSAGWCAHRYRSRFSVWPNDKRVRNATMDSYSADTERWIKAQNIRWQHSKKRA